MFGLSVMLLALCGYAFAAEAGGLWIDVPFVHQEREGCGAATIAMVMQYWQQKAGQLASTSANADQILSALHSDAAHGIFASDMVRYFGQNGYRTFAFAADWPDLERHLASGRPLIVALKPSAAEPLHYVVVAGLDPDNKLIILNDPAQRKLLKEEAARFEREWEAAGHWTLLAVPEARAR